MVTGVKTQKESKNQKDVKKDAQTTIKTEEDIQFLAMILKPVKEGDYIQLRECIRESRKLR